MESVIQGVFDWFAWVDLNSVLFAWLVFEVMLSIKVLRLIPLGISELMVGVVRQIGQMFNWAIDKATPGPAKSK